MAPTGCIYCGFYCRGTLLNIAQLKRSLGEHKMSQSGSWGDMCSAKGCSVQSEEPTTKGSNTKRGFEQMQTPTDKGRFPQPSNFLLFQYILWTFFMGDA